MLVLSRRKGESIVIDVEEGIEITVLEASPGTVRLGIRAPRSIDVWRKEVILQVKDANKAAAAASPGDAKKLGEILGARRSKDKDKTAD